MSKITVEYLTLPALPQAGWPSDSHAETGFGLSAIHYGPEKSKSLATPYLMDSSLLQNN